MSLKGNFNNFKKVICVKICLITVMVLLYFFKPFKGLYLIATWYFRFSTGFLSITVKLFEIMMGNIMNRTVFQKIMSKASDP